MKNLIEYIKKLDGYNDDIYEIDDIMSEYYDGKITLEEAIEGAKEAIRYYNNMHLE